MAHNGDFSAMHPSVDLAQGRFTVGVGRGWADLLTPINFYRMNVTGFGLDVVVQAGAKVVPGVVIYPQIMATCQLDGARPRRRDGNYELSGRRPRNRDGIYDGPPSLVAEIFARDEPWEDRLVQSQELLVRGGVTEYVAICPGGLLWFRLGDGLYTRGEPDEEGIIRSCALPGLWFNVVAHKRREYSRMFTDIIQGIESALPEKYWAMTQRR